MLNWSINFFKIFSGQVNTETSTTQNSGLEASALSAFLIPGGQVPASKMSGRPTITKVPSPNFGSISEHGHHNSKITTVTNSSRVRAESQSSASDRATSMQTSPFDWYFRNYNYTTEEPFDTMIFNGATKVIQSMDLYCSVYIYIIFRVFKLIWSHLILKRVFVNISRNLVYCYTASSYLISNWKLLFILRM